MGGDGERRAKGTTGREMEGGERGSVTQSVKEGEERRKERSGLVVNGYNWAREAVAK